MKPALRTVATLVAGALLWTALTPAGQSSRKLEWIDDTYEDFRGGQFDASGQNLFATRKGQVKTITRFDLNSDGFLDLVFSSSHDFVTAPAATLYESPGGRQAGKTSALPPLGTSYAAVADLNKDGFLDLALAPNDNWIGGERYLFVLWGAAEGWSSKRMTNLLAIEPRALKVADWDGDGWPDIAVLNGALWGTPRSLETTLRIYWGGERGFRQEAFREIALGNAVDMESADLDGDRHPELILLQSKPGEISVLWHGLPRDSAKPPERSRVKLAVEDVANLAVIDHNRDGQLDLIATGGIKEEIGYDPTTGQRMYRHSGLVLLTRRAGHEWDAPRSIVVPPASALASADFNQDGWPDVVLANGGAAVGSVQVLWGDAEGFYRKNAPTVLPIAHGASLAVTDLDRDGHADLVVGVGQTEESYESSSRIFFGDGQGHFTLAEYPIATAAVTDVVVAPMDKGPGYRLIFCNRIAGRIREDVPTRVFWGGKDGFDSQRFSAYRLRSGYASFGADFNDDGYPDLAMASIVHAVAEDHPEIGFNILWGGKDGLRDERRSVVKEPGLFVLSAGDVDRDGYLDLLGTCTASPVQGSDPPRIVIWHGGPAGFDPKRRVTLPASGVKGCMAVADFNKDGFLDLAASRGEANLVSVFWNSATGFSAARSSDLPLVYPDDMSTADLDGNGWLDLIVTSFMIPDTRINDFGTYVFWGGPEGFKPTNAQRLPSHAGCGINVADYDRDGHLDLLIPNYRVGNNRSLIPSYLFWGSREGFSELNRTDLPINAGHAALSGDFNQDGLTDVAISAHATNETHITNSRVYFNDGRRFAQPRFTELPTVGSHHMNRAEPGSIYDRSYRQAYLSRVFKWDGPSSQGRLVFQAETPGKSRLECAVRAAPSEAELSRQTWSQYHTEGKPVFEFKLSPADRCLQYRLVFVSDNGDRYPVLDRVEVRLE